MLLAIVAVIVGLAVLVWSADKFVDGAVGIAEFCGMSTLLIGMVIVGFGTSAPELTVSAISAAQGNPELSLGNAYGSNIANIALILGAVLCYIGGWVIVVIGITAILFAWLYTATPYSLSYLGIADVFVFLYYGVIATWGTVWLLFKAAGQELDFGETMPVYAGAVCGLISMCVLFINNIRDMDDDRLVGKRTIPVRFGIIEHRLQRRSNIVLNFHVGGLVSPMQVLNAVIINRHAQINN